MKKISHIKNIYLRRIMLCVGWILSPFLVLFGNLIVYIEKYFKEVLDDFIYLGKITKKFWNNYEDK